MPSLAQNRANELTDTVFADEGIYLINSIHSIFLSSYWLCEEHLKDRILGSKIPAIFQENPGHFFSLIFSHNLNLIMIFSWYICHENRIIKGIMFPDISNVKFGSKTLFLLQKICLLEHQDIFNLSFLSKHIKTVH